MRLTGSTGWQVLLLIVLIITFLSVVLIPIGIIGLIQNVEIYEV